PTLAHSRGPPEPRPSPPPRRKPLDSPSGRFGPSPEVSRDVAAGRLVALTSEWRRWSRSRGRLGWISPERCTKAALTQETATLQTAFDVGLEVLVLAGPSLASAQQTFFATSGSFVIESGAFTAPFTVDGPGFSTSGLHDFSLNPNPLDFPIPPGG